MSAPPTVSVLIVSHRTRSAVLEGLAAWRRAPPERPCEILVLENGSGELVPGDLSVVPGARLVISPQNVGFGAGNNLLVREARADLLLFLNPDAVPRPGSVDRLAEALLSDSSLGGAVPLVVDPDGHPEYIIERLPRSPLETFWIQTKIPRYLAGLRADRAPAPPAFGPVENAPASAWMLRRRAFEAVGGFDEAYFLYWEDIDLCARLRRAGERLVRVDGAVVVHRRSASYVRGDSHVFIEGYRSWRLYLDRHFPGARTLPLRLAALAWETGKGIARPRLIPRVPRLARTLLEPRSAIRSQRTISSFRATP